MPCSGKGGLTLRLVVAHRPWRRKNLMKPIAYVSKVLPASAEGSEMKILEVPVFGFWGLGEVVLAVYYEVVQAVDGYLMEKSA